MINCVNASGQVIASFLVSYHAVRWVLANPQESCVVWDPYNDFNIWFPGIVGKRLTCVAGPFEFPNIGGGNK